MPKDDRDGLIGFVATHAPNPAPPSPQISTLWTSSFSSVTDFLCQSETSVQAVHRLIDEAKRLRTQLRAEKRQLLDRLAEIDRALAILPSEPHSQNANRYVFLSSDNGGQIAFAPVDSKSTVDENYERLKHLLPKQTLSALIQKVLTDMPGATAGEVIKAVCERRPKTSAATIHTALYRLAQRGVVRGEEHRGARRYFIESGGGPNK